MNTLKQLFLTVAFTICLAMTASAQQDNREKPPPKAPPPTIPARPKPTPDKPKEDRKRPPSFMIYFREKKN